MFMDKTGKLVMMNKNTLQINKQDGSLTIKNYPIVLKKGLLEKK